MSDVNTTKHKGVIAWFASNSVAANLLMFMIFVFGLSSAFSIKKQTTPDFEINLIQVTVPYPGAAPQEVEKGIVIKIEEAVSDVDDINEINGSASEGVGTVSIEVSSDADIDQVLSDVKTRVDAISTFPELSEKAIINKFEIPIPVIFVSVYGDLGEYARKELARQLRDDLIAIPEINDVELLGDRAYEISIEVTEDSLRRYQLSMTEISQAVRSSSRDVPGGTIKTDGGDILLRTQGQVYTGAEFEEITLRTFPDGTRLRLGDVANINDGFVEQNGFGRHNGQPTITLRVLAGGQQNEIKTSALVKEYIAGVRETLPEGIVIESWVDRANYLNERLDMMLENMLQGAILVFIVLTLFLRLKVALWVIVGIPVTFLGALWLMPYGPFPVTVNMISLFAFILVLGIVVDDAIIIGESVYTTIRADGHTLDNVIVGTQKVATAATFGVLTTIAAFAPMLFVGGVFAPFLEAMSAVVALCLMFSLIESKLILPSHLAHTKIKPVDEVAIFSAYRGVAFWRWPAKFLQRIQRRTQHGLRWVIERVYLPSLRRAVENRGITVAVFFAMLIITGGVLASGKVRVVVFPKVPGEFIMVNLAMQSGTAPAVRNEALTKIERALMDVRDDYMRDHPEAIDPVRHLTVFTTGDTGGQAISELPPANIQPVSANEITASWRERVGEIAGVRELTFSDGNNLGGGAPLSFALSGNNYQALEAAAAELAEKLAGYDGVFDILNSATTGGQEIRLQVKPQAQALGITISSLGTQVRQAFYGEEAQRIQRGSDEIKVMVRYPEAQRRSIADLESMMVITPDGSEVPFSEVAEVELGQGYSSIQRRNGKRTVTVSADLDPVVAQPGNIIKDISENYMPVLLAANPGVSYALEGASLEEQKLIGNFVSASFAALFLIYALIAIPLRSYSQPLIIMSVIPFGFIGAILGHIIMDKAISMFSMFGLIALAGVVVNDSLIMIDFVNKARAEGKTAKEAVIESGAARFRAIILTSLTTAVGLMPIMLETSTQAQFVIPMAISLSFGIIVATVITLVLIPCLYLVAMDFKHSMRRARDWMLGRSPSEPVTPASQPVTE